LLDVSKVSHVDIPAGPHPRHAARWQRKPCTSGSSESAPCHAW
jgi:hypothetical protein